MHSPETATWRAAALQMANTMATRRRSHDNPAFIADFDGIAVQMQTVPPVRKKSISLSSKSEKLSGSIRRQIFAAFAANLGAAALGTVLSWTATALPDLRAQQSLGDISESQESWIGPIAMLGAAASCPFAGQAIGRLGRRMSMLCIMPVFVASWSLIYFSQNFPMMCAGRFFTGFCAGSLSIAIPVFLTEVADVNIRGALTSGFDLLTTVGILYIFLIGTYVTWQVQALACAVFPILSGFLLFFVPESPQFLLEKGRIEEASKAVAWFRGLSPASAQVGNELEELKKSLEESRNQSGSWKDLLQLSVLKPVSIGLALMFFQQCSGIDAVMLYTVDIFHSAGSDINENLSTNIVGTIQVVATIASALVVDRCGRRLLLLVSEFFMVVSLGGLGLFFYLKNHNGSSSVEALGWLPLTSLMVFVVSFSLGFGPIPWLYMGEVLPTQVKGVGSGLVTISRWLLGFGITIQFGALVRAVGEEGAYWVFGSLSLLGGFYVFFFVPETKGRTLDEIQLYFGARATQKSESRCSSDDNENL